MKAGSLALAGLALESGIAIEEPMRESPNLILVIADQLGLNNCGYATYWNGENYRNAQHAHTPNLNKFASEGVNFKNCVSSMPVCSAFRATLMTGKYTTSHGMVINELQLNPYQDCLGHVLTRAGYNTAYIGKWHVYANELGDHYNPENSFIPRGPHRLGFNGFWAAYNFHHDYYGTNSYYHTESTEKRYFGAGVYEVDGQTDMAMDWLRCRAQKSSSPFAMVLSWGAPHDPWSDANTPAAFRNNYSASQFSSPPNYIATNDPYADSWASLSSTDRANLNSWRKNYYAMTENVDWNFGRLMNYLDESGLAEDTIVIFSSDHGEMFGAQGRRAKNIFYEEAARIPMLVRWPAKMPAGQISDACISTVDFPATICGLAGLEKPERWEGTDLSKHALGEGREEPEQAYMQGTGATAAWDNGHEWRAVRSKQYTFARYRIAVSGAAQELLFDNINDPYQMTNLVGDAAYAGVYAEMSAKLEEKLASYSDTFEACTYYRDNWTDGNRCIIRGARG